MPPHYYDAAAFVTGKISRKYETRQALCFDGEIFVYWYISAARPCCLLRRSVVGGIGSCKAAHQDIAENLLDPSQRKVMHRSSVDGQAHATGAWSFVAIHRGSPAVAWRLTAIAPCVERQPTAAFAMEELSFTNECVVNYRAGPDRPDDSHSPCPLALLASQAEEGRIQSHEGSTHGFQKQ
jgi:hypothetical protein